MKARCLAAGLILAAFFATGIGTAVAQQPRPPRVPALRTAWDVTVTQIDKAGTVVGDAKEFSCTATGCEQPIVLDIDGKPIQFLAVLTFVPKGAYVAVQSMQPEIRKVVEFEKGFQGPIFLQVRQESRYSTTLRLVLIGAGIAESDANSPQLMPSNKGLVFHRKLAPDLTLRLTLQPAAPKPAPTE